MKRTTTTFLTILICLGAFTQAPNLTFKAHKGEQPISIQQLHVDVEIMGNYATTTYDLRFYNPNQRILQGELTMPLAEGQEICRYALEVNGNLREGVMVDKIKARQAYEAVVRRKIDPGLIQKTKGNFFKTKIYPIPAKGTKHVVIAIAETLNGDAKFLRYTLPFSNPSPIADFQLNAKVIRQPSTIEVDAKGFENIRFDHKEDAQHLSIQRKDIVINKPLRFNIPQFIDKNYQLFTTEFEGDTYFYLNVKPPELKTQIRKAPKHIHIYWDHSISGLKRDLKKEITFLQSYFSYLPGYKNVVVHPFNIKEESPQSFNISQNTDELSHYLNNLPYDGATRLSCITWPRKGDEILLFSDGISTINSTFNSDCDIPIYTISSSAGSNYNILKQLAARHNGTFINLQILEVKEALKILQQNTEHFLSADFKATELVDVLPSTPQMVGNHLEITGILMAEKAKISLQYGFNDKITHTQSFEIEKSNQAPVQRIWAIHKMQQLQSSPHPNKDEITALSKRFNIITDNTSLLVLDRVQDYVQHEIVPPPELQEAYYDLLRQKPKSTSSKETVDKRNFNRFQLLYHWWEDPFYTKKIEYKNAFSSDDEMQSVRSASDNATIPITRQENVAPPPPPQFSDALNIVDEEIELDVSSSGAEEALQGQMAGVEISNRSEVEGMISNAPGVQTRNSNHDSSSPSSSHIEVLAWKPDAPYLKVLRSVEKQALYTTYLELREQQMQRPSFYIQVAHLIYETGLHDLGTLMLSNCVELDLENPELLKVVARKYMDMNELDMAISIFEEIKALRPEEPQSYRDLALAYWQNKNYQKAFDLFSYIMDNDWPRYEGIKDIVLNEINCLYVRHQDKIDHEANSLNFIKAMPLDVRIVIDWSSNDNDIDLWVVDPNDEKCFYQNTRTKLGAKISQDFTTGYGPEEYTLKNAIEGTYTVYVNYFRESRQSIVGPVTVYATLYTHYGKPIQKEQHISIQVNNNAKTLKIATLSFAKE